MKIQQLSIFVENREGRLAQITEVLAAAQIDIRAISVADTSDFGILRLIVNDPGQAVKALKAAGMTVSLSSAGIRARHSLLSGWITTRKPWKP